MQCPKCYSKRLDIRQPTGLEPVAIFLTNKRKFRCRECDCTFRAPDRRQLAREQRETFAGARVAGLSR